METKSEHPEQELHIIDSEVQVIKELEGKEYISTDDFFKLLTVAGADRNNSKSGTYMPAKEGGLYVYAKRDFITRDLERAKEKLLLCQELTKRGALFPATKWGIFQRPSGQYQVFAVTRKLDLVPPSEDPLRNSKILHERLGPDYSYVLDEGEANTNPMGHQPGSSELYPVDIEVIGCAFNEQEAIERELEYQRTLKPDIVTY